MAHKGKGPPPGEALAFMTDLLDRAIKPHAGKIATITESGDIAIVVFEPLDTSVETAKNLGWDGSVPVLRMADKKRKSMVEHFQKVGDRVSERWFASARNGGRIFLLAHAGSLLLNLTKDGLAPEPGSLDSQGSWKS
jgi:hypothetical protein